MKDVKGLSRFLGWFSLGLGLSQVLAPDKVARLVGLDGKGTDRKLMFLIGLREISCGIAVLSRPRAAGWLWARVAGDAMDIALLGRAFGLPKVQRNKLAFGLAAVLGVTGLDWRAGKRLSQA